MTEDDALDAIAAYQHWHSHLSALPPSPNASKADIGLIGLFSYR
jgi:hypothetical protein